MNIEIYLYTVGKNQAKRTPTCSTPTAELVDVAFNFQEKEKVCFCNCQTEDGTS